MLQLFAGLTNLLYVPRSHSVSIACTWHARKTCCHGKYKRVPPTPPDHFSSDSHGDETDPFHLKHAVNLLPTHPVFHNPDCFHGWTVRHIGLCVNGTNLGQRKYNEFRVCAIPVPNLALV